MSLWVVTDIFGDQPPLRQQLATLGADYRLVQPYQQQMPAFQTEDAAYHAFLAAGGMTAYIDKLQQQLADATEPVSLLGFSAGASAAWVCAADKRLKLNKVFGLYGGQIRDYSDLQPACPVTLLFCQQEQHFSMPQLLEQLKGKAWLTIQSTPQPHGFVNPLSPNYQADAAQHFWSEVRRWLSDSAK